MRLCWLVFSAHTSHQCTVLSSPRYSQTYETLQPTKLSTEARMLYNTSPTLLSNPRSTIHDTIKAIELSNSVLSNPRYCPTHTSHQPWSTILSNPRYSPTHDPLQFKILSRLQPTLLTNPGYSLNPRYSLTDDKDKDLFIGLQEFVVGYSKAPEQPQSSARPICHSHCDEHRARTSHHTHCCI